MCSLFGYLDYKGKIGSKALQRLVQKLADAAEERGTDATGIAYFQHEKLHIYKRPKPAHKMRFHIPSSVRTVMGHTRFATQGSEKQNWNNHPFAGKASGDDFALAHNGILYNDKTLRRSQHLPETKIETDSYIAVQLLEHYGSITPETMQKMAETVQGSFVFTILDKQQTLHIIKGSNPLHIYHFERSGLYVYASTESILKAALSETILKKAVYTEIPFHEGEILSIDCNGNITRNTFVPEPFITGNKWLPQSAWYDDYLYEEELLLDNCKYYGVSEGAVTTLLAYGYTPTEVEDMLMDTTSLERSLRQVMYSDEAPPRKEEFYAQG